MKAMAQFIKIFLKASPFLSQNLWQATYEVLMMSSLCRNVRFQFILLGQNIDTETEQHCHGGNMWNISHCRLNLIAIGYHISKLLVNDQRDFFSHKKLKPNIPGRNADIYSYQQQPNTRPVWLRETIFIVSISYLLRTNV